MVVTIFFNKQNFIGVAAILLRLIYSVSTSPSFRNLVRYLENKIIDLIVVEELCLKLFDYVRQLKVTKMF